MTCIAHVLDTAAYCQIDKIIWFTSSGHATVPDIDPASQMQIADH